MATRTFSESLGGYALLRSHALCDGCGKEHPDSYQGRVTAPLPSTWKAFLEGSELRYSCDDCLRAATESRSD